QHFALMTMAALLASTVTSTVRGALVAGTVAALGTWLVDVGLGTGAIMLVGAGQVDVFLLAALGPAATYLIEFPYGPLIAVSLATLLVREIAVRVLWRITLCTARPV